MHCSAELGSISNIIACNGTELASIRVGKEGAANVPTAVANEGEGT